MTSKADRSAISRAVAKAIAYPTAAVRWKGILTPAALASRPDC